MKRLFKIIKWGMLIVLIGLVLAFTERKQEEQLVQLNEIDIEISEDQFLTKDIILEYIEKQNITYEGAVLRQFYLNNLEDVLLNHPSVKNAEAYSNQQGITASIVDFEHIEGLITSVLRSFITLPSRLIAEVKIGFTISPLLATAL